MEGSHSVTLQHLHPIGTFADSEGQGRKLGAYFFITTTHLTRDVPLLHNPAELGAPKASQQQRHR